MAKTSSLENATELTVTKPRPRAVLTLLAAGWRTTNAFRTHTRALYRSGPDDRRAQEEGFEAAQWALQTDAAHALAQMSARFALGSTPLAAVVREQQDLIACRQAEDSRLLAAIGRGDTHLTEQSRATLSEISAKLSSIDIRLGTEFPQYADMSEPKPLSIADTQLLLARDEALMLFLDIPRTYSLPEESLGFLVTRETFRWFRIPIGPRALGSQVAALRCGLDETLWLDATDWPQATEEQLRQRTAQIAHRKRCEALLKATPRAEVRLGLNQVLPFDLERANKLYQALFGQIEELIKNKHLLMVPAGPLTALPFHVLITQKPRTPLPTQSDGYGDAAWLAKSNAITVLPSVASLKACAALPKRARRHIPSLVLVTHFSSVHPAQTNVRGRDKTARRQAPLHCKSPRAVASARSPISFAAAWLTSN